MQILGRAWGRFFPNPGYYGWAVVGLGFLCAALSSPGQSFAISLYLEHLIADLGISRMELSSLYAVATLLAAACLPMVGGISDRTTGRQFLTPVVLLMGLSLVFLSQANGVIALGIGFFALRMLGQGAIGLGTLTVTVRWFRKYRGRALAVVTLGYAVGQMVFPGAVYGLIELVGWRGSLLALALLYLVLFTPAVGWLLRERSPDTEPLDGEPVAANGAAAASGAESEERSFPAGEVLRMPLFWGMLACACVLPLVSTAVVFHQVALFAGQGWSAALVPPAFLALAAGSVAATYVTGLVLERVPSRFGIAVSLGLVTVALLATLLPIPALAGALLYGTLLGIGSGIANAANSIVWPDYFGIASLGAIKGVVNAVRNGSSAIGPPAAAALMTANGSFSPAILVFGAIAAVGAVSALALHPPGREQSGRTAPLQHCQATE